MVQLIFWIIAIVAIAAILLIIKTRHLRHKYMWIIILIAILIFYAGYAFSIAGKNINWNSAEGIQTAGKLYLGWFVNSFDNMKTLTGQAIKMDWGGNSSNEPPVKTKKK